MKKVLYLVYIILIIIALKFIYNISMNSILIKNYKDGEYSTDKMNALTTLNFIQKYVAHYNYGNMYYKSGEYEKAIEEYREALEGSIPKNKECKVRINYALAICETVEVDEKKQEEIKEAIKKYESAVDVLTEKGCASKEDDDGHSKKAQTLKDDIQDEIDRLKKLKEDDDEDDGNDEEEKPEEREEKEEDIETKIQNIRENAIIDQRQSEDTFKNFNNYDFDTPEKNW